MVASMRSERAESIRHRMLVLAWLLHACEHRQILTAVHMVERGQADDEDRDHDPFDAGQAVRARRNLRPPVADG